MNCKKKFVQMVIPVFYGLDPSHVRKQTGDFGKIFEETCHSKTEVKSRWKEALTNVANILGYHSKNMFVKLSLSFVRGNEATMIEAIANDKIIEVDHLGVVKGKLKDLKVLIIIDDLDDQVVLDTLVGGDEWFGPRSRVIVITKDKQILRGHGIKCIYEVGMPSENLALRMFCQSAFRQNYPPVGFMELASEVAARAGGLPLGLNILGACLRARNKKYWVDMLPTLGKGLDGKIEKALRSDEPGECEFLIDSKDVCDVLEDSTVRFYFSFLVKKNDFLYFQDTKKVLDVLWRFGEGFDYLPPKLRFLRLDGYPMKCMPSNFCPTKLHMQGSKLEKLWEGVHSLTGLRKMDLQRSRNLKEIPNLSMAINLETLNLAFCSSLVELPSSIQYLNKLKKLDVTFCENLEILPTGMNLESLERFTLKGCSRLKSFPDISTNISVLDLSETAIEEFPSSLRLENLAELGMCRIKSENLWERVQPLTPLMAMLSSSLTRLYLSDIPTLVELPSSFHNLNKLKSLSIRHCINLETLPNGINLKSLDILDLTNCSRLRSFPDISTNISELFLSETGIEEVPWWIENFSNLSLISMWECRNLKHASLNISKLKHLEEVDFSGCWALTEARLTDSPTVEAMSKDNYLPNILLKFINCFNLNQEAQQTVLQELVYAHVQVMSMEYISM
ncbi:unnamed protein product [Brassica napus]|uniref:(rape) hypothetical protein n=1 Tax=Brassica napus TaxID=3708 RepID=A0A816WVN0_BRANA|nr:unnamed protein product [Brassica napus]